MKNSRGNKRITEQEVLQCQICFKPYKMVVSYGFGTSGLYKPTCGHLSYMRVSKG